MHHTFANKGPWVMHLTLDLDWDTVHRVRAKGIEISRGMVSTHGQIGINYSLQIIANVYMYTATCGGRQWLVEWGCS
jgi:hypothetical protein